MVPVAESNFRGAGLSCSQSKVLVFSVLWLRTSLSAIACTAVLSFFWSGSSTLTWILCREVFFFITESATHGMVV